MPACQISADWFKGEARPDFPLHEQNLHMLLFTKRSAHQTAVLLICLTAKLLNYSLF